MTEAQVWIIAGTAALSAIAGNIATHLWQRLNKRDCADCGPMNALLEAVTVIIQYDDKVPTFEKSRIQSKLTVPGK